MAGLNGRLLLLALLCAAAAGSTAAGVPRWPARWPLPGRPTPPAAGEPHAAAGALRGLAVIELGWGMPELMCDLWMCAEASPQSPLALAPTAGEGCPNFQTGVLAMHNRLRASHGCVGGSEHSCRSWPAVHLRAGAKLCPSLS